jgi:NitT/TauT family transport system substrate-binding protein
MRNLFNAVLCTVLLIALWACNDSRQKEQEEAAAREDSIRASHGLKVALLPTLDAFPLMAAQEAGVLDSLQLNIVLVPFAAQMDCDTALINGAVDVAMSDVVHAAWRQYRDSGLYVIGETFNEWKLVINKSQRVRKLSGLKEKILAINRNSTDEYITYIVGDSLGFADDDMYRPQINDIALRTSMLLNNQIDGAVLPEPFASYAEYEGHTALYSTAGKELPRGVFMASWRAVNDSTKKQQMQQLIDVYRQGCQLIEKQGYIRFPQSLSRFNASQEFTDSLPTLPLMKPLQPLNERHTQQAVEWLLRKGSIKKNYTGDTLFIHLLKY